MRHGIRRVFILIPLIAVISGGYARAQVNPGTPSFSAYDGHEVDTVNLQNLNVALHVPIMNKGGAFPFIFGITANSNVYVVSGVGSWYSGMYSDGFVALPKGFVFSAIWTYSIAAICPDGTTYTTKYENWVLIDGYSTRHPLPTTDYTDSLGCLNASFKDQTIDGSGFTVSITKDTVNSIYDPSGNAVSNGSVKDTNGNTISANSSTGVYTDTLGVTTLTQSGSNFTWPDVNSTSSQVTVTQTPNLTVRTNFACAGITELNVSGTSLLTSIGFPDSTTLGVTYESTPAYSGDLTGRIAQLTLRSGGTVTYNYNPSSAANDGINCTYQVPNKMTRTTSDGTTTYTWAPIASGRGNTTTVVDNGGNTTTYQFMGGILTQVQHYQDSSTLLTTDVYCYNKDTNAPNCANDTAILPIREMTVYHTINGMSSSSATITNYDSYGNVTYFAQYDFGQTLPTVQTTTTYGTWNGSACVPISSTINDKPCDVLTTEVINATTKYNVAESRFSYDAHGNLLTTYKWTGPIWLNNPTPNVYNSNGTPNTIYDFANNSTSYSYNGQGGCNNLLPTSVTTGGLTKYMTWYCDGAVLHTISNPNSSSTVTSYGYVNPFWRVTSVTDPMGNTVNKTYPIGSSPNTWGSSFTFNSGNSIQATTTTTDGYGRATNVQKLQAPGATTYDTVSTWYGWGGVNNDKKVISTNVPCTAGFNGMCGITNQTFIDVLERVTWASTPATGEYVQTIHPENDVLSILAPAPSGENNKQVQNQYDGLGRLQYSCAIGNGPTTPCGQNTGSANGVTTSYIYPSNSSGQTAVYATRGAQWRAKTYDSLGRLVGYRTPEGGNTTYAYDNISGVPCGTYSFPGHLVLQQSPNGNFECYDYDSLGRLLDISAGYSGGGTVECRRFRYDKSTGVLGSRPSGVNPANPYGHMVEAETDNCHQPVTITTDEWFSYDTDGRMTDLWELTPNSGGVYYHTSVGYYGNGAPSSLSGIPNYGTVTYGLDGEGRLNTATQGTTNIVTGTTYNAASQPLTISIGSSGDNDTYTYDPNTGLMNGYTFTVNSVTDSAILDWNPNGTLGELKITDGFNSGGTHNCTFSYDDLIRLDSDSCGSTWSQTFSYDQYDNLTKSGSITWNPGYNQANNQYQIAGVSYDASGNLLYDGYTTYTWNNYQKMASIWGSGTNSPAVCGSTGVCITYDAFGRAVEKNREGTYSEILYSPLGKTAIMAGQTTSSAYIPLPGGATYYESGSTGGNRYFWHKDWLGSARLGTDINARTPVFDRAFAPYGEMYLNFGQTNQLDFTGDTQDLFGSRFDTPNRELNPNQGRWESPDPAGAGWNQYAYATNPNLLMDPSGLFTTSYANGDLHYGDEGPDVDQLWVLDFIFTGDMPGWSIHQVQVPRYFQGQGQTSVSCMVGNCSALGLVDPGATNVVGSLSVDMQAVSLEVNADNESVVGHQVGMIDLGLGPVNYAVGAAAGTGAASVIAGMEETTDIVALTSAEGAAAKTTTLFRAVTNPELESIQSLNAFSNPAGIEVKYFSASLEGAQSYASQATSAFGDGPFSFVKTSIPTSSITPEMLVTVDRGIQTVVVPTGLLPSLSEPIILGVP